MKFSFKSLISQISLEPYLGPQGRDFRLEDGVESGAERVVHDDDAVDGQSQVEQITAHGGDHARHTVDLQSQEDAHGLQRAVDLVQGTSHLSQITSMVTMEGNRWQHTFRA